MARLFLVGSAAAAPASEGFMQLLDGSESWVTMMILALSLAVISFIVLGCADSAEKKPPKGSKRGGGGHADSGTGSGNPGVPVMFFLGSGTGAPASGGGGGGACCGGGGGGGGGGGCSGGGGGGCGGGGGGVCGGGGGGGGVADSVC